MGPVGEAGPKVIIPLTRPQRARALAEASRLLDLLSAGKAEAPKTSGAGGGDTCHTWNITAAGDGETTARRVLNRLAVNRRPYGVVTWTWRG
ncbi:hypothetical protein ACFY4I_16175 [Streptomyces scabiei]|uniref:hypothetical protein n=1 Tax=Streptomyces scabiei TaxID=1930 RepID=UPI003675E678